MFEVDFCKINYFAITKQKLRVYIKRQILQQTSKNIWQKERYWNLWLWVPSEGGVRWGLLWWHCWNFVAFERLLKAFLISHRHLLFPTVSFICITITSLLQIISTTNVITTAFQYQILHPENSLQASSFTVRNISA